MISADTLLPPHILKALVENSSKPLVIQGQLSSWLKARSWSAVDISQDLTSNPPTSFKVCPRRGTSLYQSFTDGGKRAVFETDCLHIEATFAHFKEWLALNSTASERSAGRSSEGIVMSKEYLSRIDTKHVKPRVTEAPLPLASPTREGMKDTVPSGRGIVAGFSSMDTECVNPDRKEALPLTSSIGERMKNTVPSGRAIVDTTTESPRVRLDGTLPPEPEDSEDYAADLPEAPARKRARLIKTCGEVGTTSNPLLRFPGDQYWVYADYKYMCNTCADVPEILDAVDWGVFGYEGRGGLDSVLWVGSEGACTPCHYDSYGYNLVAQLSGQKRWTLFHPEDSKMLYPTRVPFEELSIFSEIDVRTPDLAEYPQFQGATPYQVSLSNVICKVARLCRVPPSCAHQRSTGNPVRIDLHLAN